MLRLAAFLTLLPALAFSDITGTASVIDGDTIDERIDRGMYVFTNLGVAMLLVFVLTL